MGWKFLPQRIIDLISKEDLDRLKKETGWHRNQFKTQMQIEAEAAAKNEKELHRQVIQFCQRHGLGVIESRMDKRPTIKKGWPDLTVYRRAGDVTLMALLELKTEKGRLSADQEQVIEEERARGVPVYVCSSLKSAIDVLTQELHL